MQMRPITPAAVEHLRSNGYKMVEMNSEQAHRLGLATQSFGSEGSALTNCINECRETAQKNTDEASYLLLRITK